MNTLTLGVSDFIVHKISLQMINIAFSASSERRVRGCPQLPDTQWRQEWQWCQVQAQNCL